MYLNKHSIHSTIRFNKSIDLNREDLLTAYAYKLNIEPCLSFDFAGGFEINIPIEGSNQHFIVIGEVVKNVILIYVQDERLVEISFQSIREQMIYIYEATKEYLKEHRKVDKVICELI